MRAPYFATVALALFTACAEDPAPPFAVEGSGRLTGRLFFDADNNGLFTPLGGDTLLSDVTVQVRQRGSSEVIATTSTDAAGEFTFDALPPGTHDVFLVEHEDVTGSLVFCVNPMRASVYRDETAFVAAPAKRGCVVRINVAEADTLNANITVAGIVTAGQGVYRPVNIYLQDPTGGMQVFGLPALDLRLGDSIEVSGQLGQFGGELQIINPVVAPNRTTTEPPEPLERTISSLLEAVAASGVRAADIGRLIVVRHATVGVFSSGNAPLDDGTGAIDIRLDQAVSGRIPTTTFNSASCYDIVGLLGYFNGTLQLKPRQLADVTAVTCPEQ
jgi:hypothetical protein